MISTNHEERPTAKEIKEVTSKKERQDEPGLMFVNMLEEFIALQEQLVALLPKMGYQYDWETRTYKQWTDEVSEQIEGLKKLAGGESEGGVVNLGDSIHKLSNLLMWLQDPMIEPDLAKAGSLLKKIEQLAHFESDE